MSDWVDKEKSNRDNEHNTPLTQSDHGLVNSRYPGCTLEYCCDCGGPTGNAGEGDGSIYEEDHGPLCYECWNNYYGVEVVR